MSEVDAPPPGDRKAKFTTGATMRHVVVMTLTGSVGLMSLFVVDFADLYFLSLLGEREVAGAIGYAGSIIFFNISVCVGIAIAISALVSRSIGAGRADAARRLAASTFLFALLFTLMLAVVLWFGAGRFLHLLGARGETHDIALSYARIIIPSLPLLALGMCCSGTLRAIGAAKLAMYTMLSGGIVNAVLDPVFIFGLGLGVDGAAYASVCARFAVLAVGLHCLLNIHGFLPRPRWAWLMEDIRAIAKIALPAMLTNVATPFGMAYVTAVLAAFGDDAVAAWAIIGRLVPLCFGVVFALSGAIGPIIGQNFGALNMHRVRRSYIDALKFAAVYVAAVSVALFALKGVIVGLFNASDGAAALIYLFCTWIAISWAFNGAQFVANAAFNNLGKPHWSTLFNWAKATLGTIPFVAAGAAWGGASGALLGMAAGSILFGIAAAATGYALMTRLARVEQAAPA
ncbi:MAG: MATE family efflux transporter [Hyphomicrobiales bacterium]